MTTKNSAPSSTSLFSPILSAQVSHYGRPKELSLRNLLDEFVWKLRKERGYMQVEIPHITKKELYETSGHWEKFKDELFRIKTREGHESTRMKPMNCPHHTQIYARKQWSYRELPQRYANTTMCYRDEQTGELPDFPACVPLPKTMPMYSAACHRQRKNF